jgi:hypothetical protein
MAIHVREYPMISESHKPEKINYEKPQLIELPLLFECADGGNLDSEPNKPGGSPRQPDKPPNDPWGR